MNKENKLGIIYSKFESISKQDRTMLFIGEVREKLNRHLNDYYRKLQRSLEKAYAKVIIIDKAKIFKDINKQIKNAKK